jgi:RNA polymerase sigma factor (sigma-70 family)
VSGAAARLQRMSTDAALLRRFRAGDDTAFGALHARYAEGVRSYAAYMLRGSIHDADDAAQDVFLRAYQSLRRDERDIDVRPWLFRVAHNRCIDILRRPVSDAIEDDAPAAPGTAASADPAAAIEQRETMRVLLRDIGALTDGQRSALLLRELGGLSHEAVAEALGISTTSSRMLVHRARTALTDAAEARETTCREVRDHLVAAADAGTKLARRDRRHMAGCLECRTFHRAHARVERELSLLSPGGFGMGALIKLLGIGGAAAGGGGAAATAGSSSLLSATAVKVTFGACCALLAGGGAAVVVQDVTTQHQRRDARVQHARPPVAVAKRSAVVAPPTETPTAAGSRADRRTAAAPASSHGERASTTSAGTDSATASPPAHEDPKKSVDLAALDDAAGTPPPTRTTSSSQAPASEPQNTIDLADFGGD